MSCGFDLGRIPRDPVIARLLRAAQLQAVKCRLAGQRRTILAAPPVCRQHRDRRVVAQPVVIDQILIAQRQCKNPLPDQGRDRVLGQPRRAAVGKTLGKPADQPERPVRRPQQQSPGIREDSVFEWGFVRITGGSGARPPVGWRDG